MHRFLGWTSILFAMAFLALPSCTKPLPPVGKDHILNYFPIEGGKVMQYRCYGKPWDKPWDENQIIQTFQMKNPSFEDGKYRAHRMNGIYAGGKTMMTATFQVEISPTEITQQVIVSQIEGAGERTEKGPLDTVLKMPPPTGEATWIGDETKISYSAYFGKTKTTLGAYDDCLVVESRWNVLQSPGHVEKHDVLNYYQRGIGLVKHENFNPDGTLDVSSSYELANP